MHPNGIGGKIDFEKHGCSRQDKGISDTKNPKLLRGLTHCFHFGLNFNCRSNNQNTQLVFLHQISTLTNREMHRLHFTFNLRRQFTPRFSRQNISQQRHKYDISAILSANFGNIDKIVLLKGA